MQQQILNVTETENSNPISTNQASHGAYGERPLGKNVTNIDSGDVGYPTMWNAQENIHLLIDDYKKGKTDGGAVSKCEVESVFLTEVEEWKGTVFRRNLRVPVISRQLLAIEAHPDSLNCHISKPHIDLGAYRNNASWANQQREKCCLRTWFSCLKHSRLVNDIDEKTMNGT